MTKKTVQKLTETIQPKSEADKPFKIAYPMVWLASIVCLLYLGTLNLGFTELDDTIFVNEFKTYNENPSNLIHSFKRGVFNETNDTYYRPLLMDSFIINYMLSETNIKGYHAFNFVLHLICVLLLFIFLRKYGIEPLHSFLLTAIFAVHPVLTQAVTWIPGRNDTLMAVFILSFMISCVQYYKDGKLYLLLVQFIFLLAALFTKETSLFVAPAFFFLLIASGFFSWKDKRSFMLYASWLIAAIAWLAIRSTATLKNDPIQIGSMMKSFFTRFPLAIQYLGKIILPFNLSVFPMMADTTYLFGIAAILILGALLLLSKDKNVKMIIAGFGWFIFLLIPLFILPSSLNDQDFEHRLYLPIIGILLVLSQTYLFNNLTNKLKLIAVGTICVVFAGINYMHQTAFSDPLSFWTEAVRTTPNSAYANMMLAARLKSTDAGKADELMLKAYQINPQEKYVNYYLGKDYLNKNSLDLAEKHLLAEIDGSAYYDAYFLMSRLSFQKHDTASCLKYMEVYLTKDPSNSQAINNYVLLLTQAGRKEEGRAYVQKKIAEGVIISDALKDLVK